MKKKRPVINILTLRQYLNPDIKNFLREEYNCVFIDRTNNNITIDKIDLILFTGGKDISPHLYDEKDSHGRNTSDTLRDIRESVVFNKSLKKIPKLGICRGGQLVTALSGGKIIQNVFNHTLRHKIQTSSGEKMFTTSNHHQMMYPHNLNKDEYKLLAFCPNNESPSYYNGDHRKFVVKEGFKEPEVVYYTKTNSLAIQGHPEKSDASPLFKNYCKDLIKKLLDNEL